MIYLTHKRLVLESEQTVEVRARSDEPVSRRVCSQLLADRRRYLVWHARLETRMGSVAARRQRELQILNLRGVALEQTHRTALVRYFRDYGVRGAARDRTLAEFYGALDASEAAIVEHRNYLVAASTQFCALDLLELVGDDRGVDLVRSYDAAYGQYFSMFCDHARARRTGKSYLLATLLPEVRDAAHRLRARVLEQETVSARAYRMRS